MRSNLALVGGILMVLGAVAHAALGRPAMSGELRSAGAPANLIGALAAGWYFGSAAMAACGLVVVHSALRLKRGDPAGLVPVRVIAAAYVLYGAMAFVARQMNPHSLGFVAIGLLAGIPASGPRGGRSGGAAE